MTVTPNLSRANDNSDPTLKAEISNQIKQSTRAVIDYSSIKMVGPAPFVDMGKKAKDLLTKDYNFDQKFTLTMLSSTGMGLTATGLKKDQIFFGDINTVYKSGNTTVDVKVDTYSNVSTKLTVNDVWPCSKAALSFRIPDHKSGKVSASMLTVYEKD
ncbi:hypothetical protein POUND7_010080 [Theobroma cacao]